MKLIDEEEFQPKKVKDSKKTAKLILIIISLLVIAIILVFVTIIYIQGKELKLYINGAQNEKVKQMMIVEDDGQIYFPIKDIAAYLGYESFSGEYTDKSEDASKCYVQCNDEIANFTLNSKKIYKLLKGNNNGNYEYFYASKPVKAINGKLYATTDAIEQAFNISFTYNEDTRRIYIYTMPYLIESYASTVLNYGYEKISEDFINQKAILKDMLVVIKEEGKAYAVIDVKGNSIIEPKYDKITYLPYSGDFLVTSNGKVGIISTNKETKISLSYDSLELIDSDTGLYLAKRNNKYGVLDSKGNIKIYIEYDQIGIDSTKFEENGIKNKYLLENGMILAKKGDTWGAFDKNGSQVLDFIYESFGYIASSNRDAINLLIVPKYNVIIAQRNKKYTLINSVGKELCLPVLDDVYMTISSGKKYYLMNYNNHNGENVEEFLDSLGVNITNKKQEEEAQMTQEGQS